ncbi:MAG: aspartyl/asparaginyl beta-hydroxylase domain-containing protein [Gammaproteobacteria bacterium]|nr:aspartyl/asparaginyl beta-hydroxylase domain-containing protein [Gammaproteobacteria bacterium]
MSTANPTQLDEAAVLGMLQASKREAAAGRAREAEQLLARVAQLAPNHPAILNELGVRMMNRGQLAEAQKLFSRAVAVAPREPALWANLAGSLKGLERGEEALEALEKALALQPRHLSSLLQKASYYEDAGDTRTAARLYRNALDCITPATQLPQTIAKAVAHARTVVTQDLDTLTAELEAPLREAQQRYGQSDRRVRMCLDILLGKRTAYPPQPTWMYFPELPVIEFFDRAMFPWMDAFEAATDAIRAELLDVLATDRDGLAPYINFADTDPLDQWRELNHDRRWSAYYLWNYGEAYPAHLARCPVTAKLLEEAPCVRIETRAPNAFFSILDAKTRIPAHTGMTNSRVTVHLPLIVPPGCGFRVGGETREWTPGKAWAFDDTIEHEAWNDSDVPRAILILDVWNPFLTQAEQDMVKVATEIYSRHYGGAGEPKA